VSEDDLVLLEAALRLDGHDVELHRYPGTGHWFMEDDRPDAFHAEAAALAWDRTVTFLDRHLRSSG
jgi:carboxymethylenebutenolidase